MKYVVIKRGMMLLPILFSDAIEHCAFKDLNPVSAGFVSPDDFECYGKSTSLKLGPAPLDSERVRLVIGGLESMLAMYGDFGDSKDGDAGDAGGVDPEVFKG